MEEKKLSEQESIELIAQMIDQTMKESAVGSGNTYLIWGYLCTFMSLAVFALASISRDGRCGWLYIAIPAIGFIISGIAGRYLSKKYKAPKTYQAKSISHIWACLAAIFAVYMIICFANWNHSECWKGMFLLGMLLPGIGTSCSGFILKEKAVSFCGGVGMAGGLVFLSQICIGGKITLTWTVLMAVNMVIALVIPGHILNYKAKKANA